MSKLLVSMFLILFLGELISADIVLTASGPIPNRYSPISDKIKKSTQMAIAELEYSKIFYNTAQTIVPCTPDKKGVRIDMQGTFTDEDGIKFHNLQAQVCGVSSKSTTSHANVAETTMSSNQDHQKGIVRAVRNAMVQSLDTGNSFEVTGSLD
eukprot:gene8336-10240_t